jgi:ribose 1,5-bisphosphate isomerase
MNHPQFNREIVEIRDDRIHGASELARRCLAILAEAAKTLPAADCDELRQRLLTLAAELAVIRPSMAPIGNLLRRWQERIGTANGDLELLRRLAAERAAALIALSRQAVTDCAAHAARWLGPGRTLMTHSLSSTVLETCRLLRNQDLRMIVTESRPLTEGRRMAERLSAWNVPTTLHHRRADGLVRRPRRWRAGRRRQLLADGSVVNKAGTALLALAAREHGRAVLRLLREFQTAREAGEPPPELEEMASAELEVPAWPGVTVRNVYFDITPARLVERLDR